MVVLGGGEKGTTPRGSKLNPHTGILAPFLVTSTRFDLCSLLVSFDMVHS